MLKCKKESITTSLFITVLYWVGKLGLSWFLKSSCNERSNINYYTITLQCVCVMHIWCECDTQVECMWFPCIVHVIPMWSASDTYVTCMIPMKCHVIQTFLPVNYPLFQWSVIHTACFPAYRYCCPQSMQTHTVMRERNWFV